MVFKKRGPLIAADWTRNEPALRNVRSTTEILPPTRLFGRGGGWREVPGGGHYATAKPHPRPSGGLPTPPPFGRGPSAKDAGGRHVGSPYRLKKTRSADNCPPYRAFCADCTSSYVQSFTDDVLPPTRLFGRGGGWREAPGGGHYATVKPRPRPSGGPSPNGEGERRSPSPKENAIRRHSPASSHHHPCHRSPLRECT